MKDPTTPLSEWLTNSRTIREPLPNHFPHVLERLRLAQDLVSAHEDEADGPELLYRRGDEVVRVPLSGRVVVGRAPECQVCIDDNGLSRQHFELRVQDGGPVVIRDLKSRNGTYVNRAFVLTRELVSGDVIEAGGLYFVYVSPG